MTSHGFPRAVPSPEEVPLIVNVDDGFPVLAKRAGVGAGGAERGCGGWAPPISSTTLARSTPSWSEYQVGTRRGYVPA